MRWSNRLVGFKPGFGRPGENDVPGDIRSRATTGYGDAGLRNSVIGGVWWQVVVPIPSCLLGHNRLNALARVCTDVVARQSRGYNP